MRNPFLPVLMIGLAIGLLGCGTTNSRKATQQLILSSAVDRSVSRLDFSPMRNKKVYLDASYVQQIKGDNFVNSEYIISSIRQQVLASGCLLQESRNDADIIIEARVGALGADDHDLTFGVPASSGLSTAASMLPGAPAIPAIPEISVGKRYDQMGAAKIAAFAYDRTTRKPVWQSGVVSTQSTARDFWVMGAGPFHNGSIYDGMTFAGDKVRLPLISDNEIGDDTYEENLDRYNDEIVFGPKPKRTAPEVLVDYQEELGGLLPVGLAPTKASPRPASPPAVAKEKKP
ncbi:DUF6655 family protein [Lignipirellula cremea]|uniref:Uncharacterized protein n=1 Tax=Lignipirellula cremea TaxID=2528010 RepID=A0A518DNY8_9BACT|nr:DUF6655 family protein [Lignipirellula cremea]QDU93552.1 hypothetical protein Pla8534_13320 [Lignipirellula cremea]